jgi:hypothetical protein
MAERDRHIEGRTLVTVIRGKINFRYTDVFDRDWFGETFFAGTMERGQVSVEDQQRGITGWTARVSAMPKPRDWDEVGKSEKP